MRTAGISSSGCGRDEQRRLRVMFRGEVFQHSESCLNAFQARAHLCTDSTVGVLNGASLGEKAHSCWRKVKEKEETDRGAVMIG